MSRLVGALPLLVSAALGVATPMAAAVAADTQPIVDLAPAPPPAVVTSAAALAEDAAVYAGRYDVPLDQALARLQAQAGSVAATDRIADAYRNRLAGIVVEHRPAFRILVSLTGDAPVPDETIAAGDLSVPVSVPVVFRTGAGATAARILAAIVAHQAAIRAALIYPPGMGVDPRAGVLLVTVGARDIDIMGADALRERIAAIAGVPVRIVAPGRAIDLAVTGGGRIERIDPALHRRFTCTSGFVVRSGAATAIATAAHCPDELDAVAADGTRTPLPFVGGWGTGFQDVQINASPLTLAPWFHAGAAPDALRALDGARGRAGTRAGDFVCHQGVTTGYSCAEILLTDYAPPGDLCGGPCTPTWVMVAGPTCGRGDSGGPVFTGTIALGLVKGASYRPDGRCAFYYYMSTDALPAGWTLLLDQP